MDVTQTLLTSYFVDTPLAEHVLPPEVRFGSYRPGKPGESGKAGTSTLMSLEARVSVFPLMRV